MLENHFVIVGFVTQYLVGTSHYILTALWNRKSFEGGIYIWRTTFLKKMLWPRYKNPFLQLADLVYQHFGLWERRPCKSTAAQGIREAGLAYT